MKTFCSGFSWTGTGFEVDSVVRRNEGIGRGVRVVVVAVVVVEVIVEVVVEDVDEVDVVEVVEDGKEVFWVVINVEDKRRKQIDEK